MNQVDHIDGEIRRLLTRIGDAAGPAPDFSDLWGHDPAGGARVSGSRRPIRQLFTAAAVVIVLIAGAAGLAVVTRNSSVPVAHVDEPEMGLPVVDPTSPVEEAPVVDQPVESSPADPVGTGAFEWVLLTPESSIARSSVNGIVAGSTGFVATGIGFDGGENQGRVWFSVDGVTWDEPAFDAFDDKVVGVPAATSEAFYVVAATNADRSSENSDNDPYLYRSVDGREWTPIGEPWNEHPGGSNVGAAGDVLLRTDGLGDLETSTDGIEWTPATLPSPAPILGPIMESNTGVAASDRHYLRGFVEEKLQIWESTNGTEWTLLPPPPVEGGVISEIDGVLTLMSNPRAQQCLDSRTASADEALDIGEFIDQQWSCDSIMSVHQFDATEQEWSLVTTNGPGPTPQIAKLAGLGDIAVTAVLDLEQTLTVWTSPAPGSDWQPEPETRLELPRSGGPQPAQIAGTHELVVIATANGGGQTTRLVVGTRNP